MESSRYYYEMPAAMLKTLFHWQDDGYFTAELDCCREKGTLKQEKITAIAGTIETIVLGMDHPMACLETCPHPHCAMREITKEVEENGQP